MVVAGMGRRRWPQGTEARLMRYREKHKKTVALGCFARRGEANRRAATAHRRCGLDCACRLVNQRHVAVKSVNRMPTQQNMYGKSDK